MIEPTLPSEWPIPAHLCRAPGYSRTVGNCMGPCHKHNNIVQIPVRSHAIRTEKYEQSIRRIQCTVRGVRHWLDKVSWTQHIPTTLRGQSCLELTTTLWPFGIRHWLCHVAVARACAWKWVPGCHLLGLLPFWNLKQPWVTDKSAEILLPTSDLLQGEFQLQTRQHLSVQSSCQNDSQKVWANNRKCLSRGQELWIHTAHTATGEPLCIQATQKCLTDLTTPTTCMSYLC